MVSSYKYYQNTNVTNITRALNNQAIRKWTAMLPKCHTNDLPILLSYFFHMYVHYPQKRQYIQRK